MQEAKLLLGGPVAMEIEDDIKRQVALYREKYGDAPMLATILVGDDKASETYIRMKTKACSECGIKTLNVLLDDDTTTEKLLSIIDDLNNNSEVSGILIQHPLPWGIDEQQAFERIDPVKDVDGVTSTNFGAMALMNTGHKAATALGIIKILEYYNIPLEGKTVVIIGRSPILGKPLAMLMLHKSATVIIAHSKTKNLDDLLKNADIVLCCSGKPGLVKESSLKAGCVVVDAGYKDGLGDYEHQNLGITQYYTPVPKGVGPVTIKVLMAQTVDAAYKLKLDFDKNK